MTAESITVELPLRGEWMADHTPAERIPSHGTDQLAQTYAYDFLRTEIADGKLKFFRASLLRYLLVGVGLDNCHGWGEPIHAPFAGRVTSAQDGWPERQRLHLLSDLAVVIGNAWRFDPEAEGDLRKVLGNYLILKMPEREVYALFAHCRTGSIRVRPGDAVAAGQPLAAVGHSGNSTAPHLHFQLMDHPDVRHARGLPCRFRAYEAFRDGAWTAVTAGQPGRRERIRRE